MLPGNDPCCGPTLTLVWPFASSELSRYRMENNFRRACHGKKCLIRQGIWYFPKLTESSTSIMQKNQFSNFFLPVRGLSNYIYSLGEEFIMVFYEYMRKLLKFRKALAVPPMYLIPSNSGIFFLLKFKYPVEPVQMLGRWHMGVWLACHCVQGSYFYII